MKTHLAIFLTVVALVAPSRANAQRIHWEQTSGPGGGLLDRMFTFENGLVIAASSYMAINGGDKYYRSTDSGQTWAPLATQSFDDPRQIAFAKTSKLLFAIDQTGGTQSSSDNGLTWAKTNGQVQDNIAKSTFLARNDSLFGITSNGFYRSTDTGRSWQFLVNGLRFDIVAVINSHYRDTAYDTVHVTNCMAAGRSTLLIACDTGVYRSTDGGEHWTSANVGLDDSIIVSLAAVGDTFLAASKTGIYRSSDAGLSWSVALAHSGILVAANAMLSSAILSDDTYSFSTDAGENWRAIADTIAPRTVTAIGQIGHSIIVATYGLGVLKTIDTGKTWVQSNAFFSDIIHQS